jgi:hypothetical protein
MSESVMRRWDVGDLCFDRRDDPPIPGHVTHKFSCGMIRVEKGRWALYWSIEIQGHLRRSPKGGDWSKLYANGQTAGK